MSYKPLIDVITSDWQISLEDNIAKAIQEYGITVDKDELIKALQYDRHQYAKGYVEGLQEGYEKAIKELTDSKKIGILEDAIPIAWIKKEITDDPYNYNSWDFPTVAIEHLIKRYENYLKEKKNERGNVI